MKLLSVKEVGEMLNYSISQVYQLTYKGELPVVQNGKGKGVRIKEADVYDFVDRNYKQRAEQVGAIDNIIRFARAR